MGRGALAAVLVIAVSGGVAAQPASPAQPAQPAPPAPRDVEPERVQRAPQPVAIEAAKDPKAARKWLTAGQQLMQRGTSLASHGRPDDARPQFENAVAAFVKAIEASDDIGLYLELAGAEEKLGKLGEATRHVRGVVEAQDRVRPEVAKRAAARLEDLLGRVGLVTLTVAPAGASITLGGAELGTSPLPEPLVLMPGTYTLSFQADGFQPREAELKVEAGSETERTIELEPVRMIVEPIKPVSEVMMQAERPQPSRRPLYIGAGVTGAAVIGASVFGAIAIRRHQAFTRASTSAADRQDARESGQRFALLADVSLATAAAAAGFTITWYLYRYRQPHGDARSDNSAKLDVAPWVQPQSGGVTLAGWF